MNVTIKRVNGAHFEALTQSGHRIQLDGPPDIGGQNMGARPMEMVLVGLAGCSAVDILHILQKGRTSVQDVEIHVSAIRADAIPAVFSEIHLRFHVSGSMTEAQAKRAAHLSMDKYCSVAMMLVPTVKITHEIQLTSSPAS